MNTTNAPDFWQHAHGNHHPEPYPDPEETTMTDQFIDRDALETQAESAFGHLPASRRFITIENFLAGVDAANAQLLANADTEWGVATLWTMSMRGHEPQPSEEAARTFAARYDVPVVSRRVLRTAWTTDEKGQQEPAANPIENALAFIAQTLSVNEDMDTLTWRGDEVMELLDTIAQTLRGEA